MYPMELSLANEHIRDLHAAASRARLLALADHDRPTAWRRAAALGATAFGGVVEWLRRGQLGAPADCVTCG